MENEIQQYGTGPRLALKQSIDQEPIFQPIKVPLFSFYLSDYRKLHAFFSIMALE